MPFSLVAIQATRPVINRNRLRTELQRAVRDQQADGVRFMAEYPPQRPGSRYRRTGTLKRSWHAPTVQRLGDAYVGEIASQGQIATYNRKVQGIAQEPLFRAIGWRGVESLMRRVEQQFPTRVRSAFQRIVG